MKTLTFWFWMGVVAWFCVFSFAGGCQQRQAPETAQLTGVWRASEPGMDVIWTFEPSGLFRYRGSWLIAGDALLACDVSQATVDSINTEDRTATVRLPALRVISARVDHEKTKTWSVEKASWLPWKWGNQGVMRDAAMFHAQQLIETAAGSERHLGPAKAQAELLIRQMYDFVDWKVQVEWE